MAWHTPKQSDLACHPARTNPLNGEGFARFIPTQKPQLALHNQGNARGKTAEVVELLTRPQAQGLEGFS